MRKELKKFRNLTSQKVLELLNKLRHTKISEKQLRLVRISRTICRIALYDYGDKITDHQKQIIIIAQKLANSWR